MDRTETVVGLVGVYHAEGGPVGEARYVIGKMLGIAHCSLCDITHSPIRRKPDWDRMVQRLGIPVTLVHLNEMDPDVAAAVAVHGSPLVLARLVDGGLEVLLDGARLEQLGGSVDSFEAALTEQLQSRGLVPAADAEVAPAGSPTPATEPEAPPEALTMYSTQWCGYCVRLKRSMVSAGIPFVEVDIETDRDAARFVESVNGGNQTVPTVVFPDGRAVTNPSIREVRQLIDR